MGLDGQRAMDQESLVNSKDIQESIPYCYQGVKNPVSHLARHVEERSHVEERGQKQESGSGGSGRKGQECHFESSGMAASDSIHLSPPFFRGKSS